MAEPVERVEWPHMVGKCDNLAPAGTLENITPAALNIAKWCWPGAKECTPDQIGTYGAHGLAIDPTDSGTLYLGTDRLGLWKTTDCGSNWVKIDTGTHQKELDSGRNWTIVIDPLDSKVIYTTPGYGAEGFYKSIDGGVNWNSMFPPNIQDSLPYGGFIETISLDPSDHRHLLATFHGSCAHSPTGGGMAMHGRILGLGDHLKIDREPDRMEQGFGQTMIDSEDLVPQRRRRDLSHHDATNWTKVHDKGASGHIFLAPNNTFFTGGYYMRQSKDGITWTEIPGLPGVYSVNGSNAIVSDGTRLYTSTGQYGGGEPKVGSHPSRSSANPSKWTPILGSNHPLMQAGGSTLIYNPDHHLLYSTNLTAGIWRGVVPQ